MQRRTTFRSYSSVCSSCSRCTEVTHTHTHTHEYENKNTLMLTQVIFTDRKTSSRGAKGANLNNFLYIWYFSTFFSNNINLQRVGRNYSHQINVVSLNALHFPLDCGGVDEYTKVQVPVHSTCISEGQEYITYVCSHLNNMKVNGMSCLWCSELWETTIGQCNKNLWQMKQMSFQCDWDINYETVLLKV